MEMLVKIGKHKWIRIDLVSSLARMTKKSKAEIKRLFKQGAIDIYLEEVIKK